MDIESVAVGIIERAVNLDNKKRYTEALGFYQEGLQVLIEKLRGENDEKNKTYLQQKIEEHWKRVAAIKTLIQERKEKGNYYEQVHIEEDSTGYGYKNLIGRFLDKEVEYVVVKDRYIRTFHQCQNFLLLCELLVKSCDNLKHIQLETGKDAKSGANQKDWFYNLKTDLQKYGIQLIIIYSNGPCFSKIILSSGWIINISRGLDIYKSLNNKFCLGVYDLDLRQCHGTEVEIVHSTKDAKSALECAAQRQSLLATSRGSHRLPNRSKPLVSRRGDQSEPLVARRGVYLKPLVPRRGDQSKPLMPRRGDQSEPLVPTRSDQSKPLVPRRGDQSEPLVPRRDDQLKPLMPSRGDQSEPLVSSAATSQNQ